MGGGGGRRQFWLSQSASSCYWTEAREATKHPTVDKTDSHNKKLSGPKC